MSSGGLRMERRFWGSCFFFQAEDGIRDLTVTGVQTCALPIYLRTPLQQAGDEGEQPAPRAVRVERGEPHLPVEPRLMRRHEAWPAGHVAGLPRSEERRVGEEGRSRWSPDHLKKKKKTIEGRGV